MVGISARFSLDTSPLGAEVARMIEAGENLEPAFDEIGAMAVSETLFRFELGVDPNGNAWAPSQRVQKSGGQTLVLHGYMRDSLSHQADNQGVEWGVNVIYGAIHQLGGQAGRGGSATIPARPFLGFGAVEQEEAPEILTRHLQGLK